MGLLKWLKQAVSHRNDIFFGRETWLRSIHTKLINDFPQSNHSIINLVLCLTTSITSIPFSATNPPTFWKTCKEFLPAIFRADSPLHFDYRMQQISISLQDKILTISLLPPLIVTKYRVAMQISLFTSLPVDLSPLPGIMSIIFKYFKYNSEHTLFLKQTLTAGFPYWHKPFSKLNW